MTALTYLCTTFPIAFDGMTVFLFPRPVSGKIQTNIGIIEMLTEKKKMLILYVEKSPWSIQALKKSY